MAVSKDDLLIKIDANTAEAVKSVKTLEDVFGGLGLQIIKANSAVQLAITGFEAFKTVVNKVTEPVRDAIAMSVEYNATLGKLRNTLKLTGEFSEASVKRFEDFSHQMEMTTTLTQEQAYTMLALAKATGVGDDAAMQMVQTAKNLSAVTGNDVNESFRALLSSLKGSSRELLVLDPTLKNLSTSAFMSGAAIEQLSKKYDGFAVSAAQSYRGITEQAKNFREEIQRNIGDVLAVAFDMKGTAEFKREMYLNVLQTIEDIKPALIEFAEGVRFIKRVLVDELGGALKSFGSSVAGVYRALSVIDFTYLSSAISGVVIVILSLLQVFKPALLEAAVVPFITLAETLFTLSSAALAAAAPFALLALKIALASAAILGAIAAVDFLIQNGLNIFAGSLEWIASKLTLVMGKFLQFIGMLREGGKLIGKSWELEDKSSQKFGDIKMGAGMEATIKKINEMKDAYKGVGATADLAATQAKSLQGGFKDRKVVDPTALEAYRTALQDIVKETERLGIEAQKSGMTQLEVIDLQLAAAERQIEAEKEKIRLSKQYTDEQKRGLIGALDDKKTATRQKADSDRSQAPGQEFEAAVIAGKSLTKDITKAFQTGTAGMVTGIMAAIDAAIGIAQAVVDFIPRLLNNLANLFNSLTDLPNKIVSGLQNLFDSILNYIANALPNLLKAIPTILRMIIKFLIEGLPQAFNALFDAVPQLVMELIDSIPVFVEGFVQHLIQTMPMIVISFIEKIIPQIPRIINQFIKMLVIELPKAIVRGIIKGINELGKAISNAFKGIKIIDTQEINTAIDSIKKLSGSTSDMFSVKDLGGSLNDETTKQFNEMADSIKDGMGWAIEKLIVAWRWIYDKIIMPIVNAFKTLFDGVKTIFDDIVKLIKPIFDLFAEAFKGAVDLLTKIGDGFKKVVEDTLKPIGDAFEKTGKILKDFIEPLIKLVEKITNFKVPGGGSGGGDGLISEGAENIGNVLTGKKKFWSSGGPVYASTGMLMYPRGTDTIPAMLTPGEFVVSAGAVKKLGLDAMHNINAGKAPASGAVYNNEFKINIEARGGIDESFVRNRLMSVIKEELRRASLDGERLLSSGGVR